MITIAADSVKSEIDRLHALRLGLSDTVMYPNKAKMDKYLIKRIDYLDSLSPMVTLATGTRVRHWEWRTQLTVTSGPLTARQTGTKQLCAEEIYGDINDRTSTLSDWTIEKWYKAVKRLPTSRYYYLCADYTGDTEVYSDISDTTISESGLASELTVANLTDSADDWYIGMAWIHATNNYHLRGYPHYSTYASFGIDYLITASRTGLDALDARGTHHTDLVSLCARYYTI
jgi:hypothetical protein